MTETPRATDRARRGPAYRTAIGLAVLAAFLAVWTTIVRDDGAGAGAFMIILAVPVGWFAARFEPAGMARTMVGVALMQAFLGLLAATAPVIANTPDGSLKAALFNGGFAALWLVSAAFFGAAARSQRRTVA